MNKIVKIGLVVLFMTSFQKNKSINFGTPMGEPSVLNKTGNVGFLMSTYKRTLPTKDLFLPFVPLPSLQPPNFQINSSGSLNQSIPLRHMLPRNFLENEIVIVTGASHNHFNALHLFLRDWSLVTRDKNRLLVIYDLGLSENQRKSLNISYPFPVVWRTFQFLKFPKFFNINEARGEYAWKASIVREVQEEWNCSVLWLDSGAKLSSHSLHELELRMRKLGFASSQTGGKIKDWVHPDSLKFLVTDLKKRKSLQEAPMCNGAIVGFQGNNLLAMQLLIKWANCSMLQECIAPVGSSRENHRQDQAVLTVLAHSLGFGHQCAGGRAGIALHTRG